MAWSGATTGPSRTCLLTKTRLDHIVEMNNVPWPNRRFFGYEKPNISRLEGEWLRFASPVETPFPENNRVQALWFPSEKANGRAMVLLPHWNSRLPQQNALCAGLATLGRFSPAPESALS